MRPFQLSAVLVSAAMLLSGCYLGRGSVKRSETAREGRYIKNCPLSGAPILADVVVSALSLAASVSQGTSYITWNGEPSAMLMLGTLTMSGLFAADAVAGYTQTLDCAEATADW
jgi:hypothetical protein